MGASIVSVGSKGGKPLFTFSAVGQDTGSLLPKIWEAQRWGKWSFMLSGTGTGYSVLLYGTYDVPTAYNEPGNSNAWFEIPSPSTEAAYQYSNPLTFDVPGRNICYSNMALVTVRAVSMLTAGFGAVTGTVSLLAFVQP